MTHQFAEDPEDLLELLDYLADAMELCAAGYLGAAKTECINASVLWDEYFRHWTDPEGERVALWLRACNSTTDRDHHSVNAAAIGRAARHAHRIVMRRLMTGFGIQWPPGGLLLSFPANGAKEPKGCFVDVAPGAVTRLIISNRGSDGVEKVTYDSNDDPSFKR